MKEVFVEFIFTIEDLKVNKLCTIFFAIQPSQERFAEYTFLIGFYKVGRNVKINVLFGIIINFDVPLE